MPSLHLDSVVRSAFNKVPFIFDRNLYFGMSYQLKLLLNDLLVEFEELYPAMKCPHCSIMFHDAWRTGLVPLAGAASDDWAVKATVCPECREPIVRLGVITGYSTDPAERTIEYYISDTNSILVYPKFPRRPPVDDAVPISFKVDYLEACDVLEISAKASAALSRRVLQGILNEQGFTGRNLKTQIDRAIDETEPQRVLPSRIRITMDAVRKFGNFAAHPITDQTTLQVIEVETGEAEWCLQIIEDLFEHYYIGPAESAKRLLELERKISG